MLTPRRWPRIRRRLRHYPTFYLRRQRIDARRRSTKVMMERTLAVGVGPSEKSRHWQVEKLAPKINLRASLANPKNQTGGKPCLLPFLLPCLLAPVPLPFKKRTLAEPVQRRNGKVVWHQTGPARGDGKKLRGATPSAAALKKQYGTRLARACCSSVPVAVPADRAKPIGWRLGAPVRQSATCQCLAFALKLM